MSIFDYSAYKNKIFNEKELDKLISNFLISDKTPIIKIFDWEFGGDLSIVGFDWATQHFLLINEIPLELNDIDKISIEFKIEIFINIYKDIDEYTEYYKKNYDYYSYSYVGSSCLQKTDLNSKINDYLNNRNIKIEQKNNKLILNLTNNSIFKNMELEAKDSINEFMKMKNEIDEDSMRRKSNILSGLKSEFDYLFKSDCKINDSDFLTLKISAIKTKWQTLFSHKGKNEKSSNHKDIKDEFDQSNNDKKNKLMIDLLYAIIFWTFYLESHNEK